MYRIYYNFLEFEVMESDYFSEEFDNLEDADKFARLMVKLWERRVRRDRRVSQEHLNNIKYYAGFSFRKEDAPYYYYFVGRNGDVRCGQLPWYFLDTDGMWKYENMKLTSVYIQKKPLPYYWV